jgi:hypothetical protein
MFRPFALFVPFDLFRSGVATSGGGSTPTETCYVLAGGDRILAGTDLIALACDSLPLYALVTNDGIPLVTADGNYLTTVS